MWNNSYWKLTADGRKDCYTNKAIRKIHREAGRKGKEEMIRICAPARGLRGKGRFQKRRSSDAPGPGSTKGRTSPFAGWRAAGTNRRAVGSLDSASEELGNTCSWSRKEKADWFPGVTQARTKPELRALQHPASHHNPTLDCGQPLLKQKLRPEMLRQIKSYTASVKEEAAITGVHRWSIRGRPDLWQRSDHPPPQ